MVVIAGKILATAILFVLALGFAARLLNDTEYEGAADAAAVLSLVSLCVAAVAFLVVVWGW